ncbi:hypothetical protein [Alkaliphilus serpentinus]|uniref:Uncharacterized protein n=1 Tax=Alkaliphilus serpentinus TaxID=1482731 RepID=A0A833HMQ1_9FIRM|nr:hypothetical protein [Alkaliphilus serpentinus]KAB3527694.1 hypothetical protein F8153_11990 [Alkaliphilus serpentinus]
MYYKLSKLAKTIIIINILLTIIVGIFHGYNVYRLHESHERILEVMEERKVIRETAIRMLQKEGEEVFIEHGMTSYFGVFMSTLTLFLLYKYAKESKFSFAFSAAFSSLLTSYIGGLLLFFVIFSGKSEINGIGKGSSVKDEWEKYIHKRGYKYR